MTLVYGLSGFDSNTTTNLWRNGNASRNVSSFSYCRLLWCRYCAGVFGKRERVEGDELKKNMLDFGLLYVGLFCSSWRQFWRKGMILSKSEVY